MGRELVYRMSIAWFGQSEVKFAEDLRKKLGKGNLNAPIKEAIYAWAKERFGLVPGKDDK